MTESPRNPWQARAGRWLAWVVPDEGARGSEQWWRGRILAAMLLTCAIAGFLVAVPNVRLAVVNRAWSVVLVDAVVYASIIGLLLARGVSRVVRAWGMLALCLALGIFFSWGWGGLAAGPLWLIAVPVIAGVLLEVRAAFIALVLTTLATIGIGVAAAYGALPWAGGPVSPLPLPGSAAAVWTIIGTNLILLGGLGALGTAFLARGLATEGEARRSAEGELLLIGRALEQGDDLVLLVTPDGTISRVNAGARTPGGAVQVGTPLAALGLRCEEDGAPPRWQDAFAGRPWSGPCTREVAGERVHYAVNISPVRDAGGTITHALAVFRDLTRQHALEGRLLTSAKLEAVGTMVGGIAHDFNNVLQPIVANAAELRQRLAADPEAAAVLEDIEASAGRGRGLVRRILTFSRGVQMPRVPTAIAGVVTEALRLTDVRRDPSIRLVVETAPDAWVLADPAELHHVVVNLVTNAWHAMPAGGTLTIRATLEPAVAPGGDAAGAAATLLLTVVDTGIGMDEATQRRMFVPFFTTKGPGRGTGLGLSTVHGTVSALGGTIDVRSAPGKGTTLAVRLPAIPAPADGVASAPAPTTHPAGAAGARVLLVDDEDAVRRAVSRLLARAGYAVTAAARPREALDLLHANPAAIDLVLTDFTMPEMTGIALAAEVRRLAPALPVILMTGLVDEEVMGDGRSPQIRRVLQKPTDPRELIATVGAVLEESRAGAPPVPSGR